MIKGYELYEMIAKGKIQKNAKFIDARNKVWKFDGAEFIKEIGDSDIYSDLEFATMDFEIIEDEKEIQSIETLNPHDEYFRDGTELVYKLMYDKINEIAMKVNQLDKKVNSIGQK